MMQTKNSPLERLIGLSNDAPSNDRRDLLRETTDCLLAAPDRYTIREMENFDVLFSRSSLLMERKLARVLAMALTKSSAPRETVQKLLIGQNTYAAQILRRSVTQTCRDILTLLREKATQQFKAPARDVQPNENLIPENRYSLPPTILEELYRFHYLGLRHEIVKDLGKDPLPLLDRTAKRFRTKILDDALEEARSEVIDARRIMADKHKKNQLNEELLLELMETKATTEFLFAFATMIDVDIATAQRVLNDMSWEALAISCRSAKISRGLFAKLVYSMQRRESDQAPALRIIGLYNKLPVDAAERVMRFWQLRSTSMHEIDEMSTQKMDSAAAQPNDAPVDQAAGFGRKA